MKYVKTLMILNKNSTQRVYNHTPRLHPLQIQMRIPKEWIGRTIQICFSEDCEFPEFISEFGKTFSFHVGKNMFIECHFSNYVVRMTIPELVKFAGMSKGIPQQHNYTLYCLNSLGEEFDNHWYNNTKGLQTILASLVICNLVLLYNTTTWIWYQPNETIPDYGQFPILVVTPKMSSIVSKEIFDGIERNLAVTTKVMHLERRDLNQDIKEVTKRFGKWSLFQDIFIPESKKEFNEFFEEPLPNQKDFEDEDFKLKWFDKCMDLIRKKHPNRVTPMFERKLKFEYEMNWMWIHQNRPNIFIEDENLCQFLLETSCKVDIDKISIEKTGFMHSFSLPSEYKFEGITIPPFLVRCVSVGEASIRITVMFRTGFFMCLTDDSTITESDLVENYSKYSWKTHMGLSQQTDDYVKFIISAAKKLTIMTLLYRQSHPEKLVDGYPTIHSSEVVTKVVKTLSLHDKYVVPKSDKNGGNSVNQKEISPHWRRAHFATLRDEGYRRNPDGSFRVILRRGSNVNADKIKAKTLIN